MLWQTALVCAPMAGSMRPTTDPWPTVLIDLAWQQPDRPELAQRMARALAEINSRLFTTDGKSPAQRPVDIVISERPDALAELSPVALGTTEAAIAAGAVGLVVLGPEAPQADAQLPLDTSDRELLLTCRLVMEIVSLRRRSIEAERKSDEMTRLASIDSLTRIANRRAWDEEAPERYRRALAGGQEICLAIFDVDHFKLINDTRGHATGDAALGAMGRDLSVLLRADDLLARLGGDEFAALLIGKLDPPGPRAIVDRIRCGIGRQQTARLGFELSVSAGCAVARPGSATATGDLAGLVALFAAADAALREAKNTGRNRTILSA
jgi:diguanylate cyclase (GGDEF)-like protein